MNADQAKPEELFSNLSLPDPRSSAAKLLSVMHPQRLILVGYRGTGKTTVGRLLAGRLGWEFADADDHIEAAAGKSIAEIFAAEGEPGFRDREAAVLRELCG